MRHWDEHDSTKPAYLSQLRFKMKNLFLYKLFSIWVIPLFFFLFFFLKYKDPEAKNTSF